MIPKHIVLDSESTDRMIDKHAAKEQHTMKSQPSQTSQTSHASPDIIITRGNPTDSEIAVLAAVFNVLSARAYYLNRTVDHWPTPDYDRGMRDLFGVFTKYRTNLRWW